MSSSYEKCRKCGEYGWTDTHDCGPVYKVWVHVYGKFDPEDRYREKLLLDEANDPCYTFHSDSARAFEVVAEKAVDRYDAENAEGLSTLRMCTVEDPDGKRALLEVQGEMVPIYHATEVKS